MHDSLANGPSPILQALSTDYAVAAGCARQHVRERLLAHHSTGVKPQLTAFFN